MSEQRESIGPNQDSPRNGYSNGHQRPNDPSGNVLDLVDASARRQDDLRDAESRHFREVLRMRAEFEDKLRTTESNRLDAIRQNDQQSLNTATVAAEARANTLAATADARATTLAHTVATSAEALRTQVQDAAAAAAIALAAALSPIQVDVSELRKAQYQTQGERTQVVESREKGMTAAQWIGVAIAIAATFLSTIMIVVTIVAILTKGFTQ